MNKDLKEFWRLAVELRPEQILGLATFYGVKLSEVAPDKTSANARDGEDIALDCARAFAESNRADRRFILKIMRQEVKENGKSNN